MAVEDWSPTAANNTAIGGINIDEGCPAAGINDAIRTMMAQLAVYVAGLATTFLSISGGAMTGAITDMGSDSTVKDPGGTARKVGYRNLPLRAATTAQILALGDVGQLISITTGGVTVPLNATVAFSAGDTVTVYNDSASSQTISAAVGVTLRLAGSASSGGRTLALRGLCTLLKVATNEWIATGQGVS